MTDIETVIKNAEAHRIPISEMTRLSELEKEGRRDEIVPIGDNPDFRCFIGDLRVVYSIEEHPIGWCRHLSVSKNKKLLPTIKEVSDIIGLFGFKGSLDECYILFEDISPQKKAVNLIQNYDYTGEGKGRGDTNHS